jgi:hypothetical protein
VGFPEIGAGKVTHSLLTRKKLRLLVYREAIRHFDCQELCRTVCALRHTVKHFQCHYSRGDVRISVCIFGL